VEGPTERNFCKEIVAAHLGYLGIEFHPRVVGKPGHKGGAVKWERAKKEMVGLIRQEPQSVFTTMFDLYGLPNTWPGREEAQASGLKHLDAVTLIEQRIGEAVLAACADCPLPIRFIPYLSQHEYEALLFSNPSVLGTVTGGPHDADEFQKVLAECRECEKINDDPDTAPSKRIERIAPRYSKTIDGIIAAKRIGVQVLREKCPHFAAWLGKLESLEAKEV
jgi:hypothetical protein